MKIPYLSFGLEFGLPIFSGVVKNDNVELVFLVQVIENCYHCLELSETWCRISTSEKIPHITHIFRLLELGACHAARDINDENDPLWRHGHGAGCKEVHEVAIDDL